MGRYVMENKHGFSEGQVVEVGGLDWAIIETNATCVRCITANHLEGQERAFDKDGRTDYSISSLRDWLEGEFFEKLLSAGVPEEMFCEFGINLMAEDGTDFGGIISRIGLLTCDQYRELRGNIPKVDDYWWTATADSMKSEYVKAIQEEERIVNDKPEDSEVGVRPVCVFDSETLRKLVEGRKMCSFCEKVEILRKWEYEEKETKVILSAALVEEMLVDRRRRGTIFFKNEGVGFPLRFCPECGKKLEDINK